MMPSELEERGEDMVGIILKESCLGSEFLKHYNASRFTKFDATLVVYLVNILTKIFRLLTSIVT